MSTAGRLRNGIASNVFVYHNYNVYVRERPSDPESFKKMFGLFGEELPIQPERDNLLPVL